MKCSFCGLTLKRGAGKMFVKNTGEILYFCKSKCQKNFFMDRKKKWVLRK